MLPLFFVLSGHFWAPHWFLFRKSEFPVGTNAATFANTNVIFRWCGECKIKCIGNYVYPRVFVEVKYFLSRSIPEVTAFGQERARARNPLARTRGFTHGSESFAKTFPLINLVYRWAGSGDACIRSRQNFKYAKLSKFTRDRCYVPPPPNAL